MDRVFLSWVWKPLTWRLCKDETLAPKTIFIIIKKELDDEKNTVEFVRCTSPHWL